tara:strand:- start:1904 stop:2686 length:783 start_codon:yes stop_codon:yes gene_type:complete
MLSKVNYLVTFYFGSRNNKDYNTEIGEGKFFFPEKHLKFLEKYPHDNIGKVIFVINMTPYDNQEEIENYFRENSSRISDDVEFRLLFRSNTEFCYGGWNDGIADDLDEDNDSEYYFCIEEDYILADYDSMFPMIERCKGDVAYVCSHFQSGLGMNKPGYIDHASHVEGVFSKESCRRVYEKFGSPLHIIDGNNDYPHAWRIQETFFKYHLEMGFKITDYLDEYSSDFLDTGSMSIRTFGDKETKRLIIPITDREYPDYQL